MASALACARARWRESSRMPRRTGTAKRNGTCCWRESGPTTAQDQHNAAVLRDLWKTFEPYTRGYYVNTEPSADEQRLRATYGDNYPRLVQLKNKYDPTNLFHLNANIKPTASG